MTDWQTEPQTNDRLTDRTTDRLTGLAEVGTGVAGGGGRAHPVAVVHPVTIDPPPLSLSGSDQIKPLFIDPVITVQQ